MTTTWILMSLAAYSLAIVCYIWGLFKTGRLWPALVFWLAGGLIDGILLANRTLGHWHTKAHLELSILSVSIMGFAGMHAILLLVQNMMLRRHYGWRFLRCWPALELMEKFLFQLVGIGLLTLTANIALSIYLFYPFADRYILGKVLFSLWVWLIFAGLLVGRHVYGWRGKIALHGIAWGLILLIILYVASLLLLG